MSKTMIGKVVSNAMDKSAVITAESSKTHPLYKKRYTTTKRFIVHDADNSAQIGDIVEVSETRPISAHKRFAITKTIQAVVAPEGDTK